MSDMADQELEYDVNLHLHSVQVNWPMTDAGLVEIAAETAKYAELSQITDYVMTGWPSHIRIVPKTLY